MVSRKPIRSGRYNMAVILAVLGPEWNEAKGRRNTFLSLDRIAFFLIQPNNRRLVAGIGFFVEFDLRYRYAEIIIDHFPAGGAIVRAHA